jgi:inhibitor of KinA sporulation pathway (predicted exonuclease)
MADNLNLKVNELDFQGIKTNLRDFLKSQDQFRDYNFEGSGLNTLLDLLAYNTYYNSFYLNMVLNEAFLTTAQKRGSVVNAAKALNYTPRSVTSASVTGTLTVTPSGSPSTISIPAYTKFTGNLEGVTFTFLNTESILISADAGSYVAENITLKEGVFVRNTFTVNTNDPDQKFQLLNINADTSTLVVKVLNSSTDTTTRTFVRPDNIIDLDSESPVYFLEEGADGFYQVKFGDGTFGVALQNGNVVVLEYLVSKGRLANDIESITYASSISGITNITFVADDPASGGLEKETLNQIKFAAPKAYESQNRAVTTEDYQALLLQQSIVDSVSVWGGEDNDPPEYGKVFIAIKPTIGNVLSATEKTNLIRSIINPKKILTVRTEIVDPEYIYLLIDTTVKYDASKTTLSAGAIQNIVTTVIKNYNDSDIDEFSKYFRYSKLSRLIDLSERSILNSDMTVRLRIETAVQLNTAQRLVIKFSNSINPSTNGRPSTHPYGAGNQITSNAFTYNGLENCFLEENNGIMRIYQIVRSERVGVVSNAGTLDYNTGTVILSNFAPSAFADGGSTLILTAIPEDKDILPLRNQIIQIRDEDISVTMVDDKTISLVSR